MSACSEIAHMISNLLFLLALPCLVDKSLSTHCLSEVPLYNWAPTNPHMLTQRQYNKGDAAQGHPGEGPCDGQHAVGDGGGTQHPKYDREHKRHQEHGFPSEPATSTGWVTAAGNLSQEQGLKWGKPETQEEK